MQTLPSPTQSQADRIRTFVLERYIRPAQAAGQGNVTVRAGDVHRQMGLAGAMPAVCSAIGGGKFQTLADVDLTSRIGPPQGANVFFRFDLGGSPTSEATPAPSVRHLASPSPPLSTRKLNLTDAIVLVSCVKSKLGRPAAARDLYISPWFRKVRELVEASGARWFILSARHGLVDPNAVIAPYELTLKAIGVSARRTWAREVLESLRSNLRGERRIVIFAGAPYREFLELPLRTAGLTVETPMAHLALGRQLAWLNNVR